MRKRLVDVRLQSVRDGVSETRTPLLPKYQTKVGNLTTLLPDSYQSNRERAGKIIALLKAKNPGYHLDFDTRIYISHMIQPRQRFIAIAKIFYDSDIVSIDFTNGMNKNNSDADVYGAVMVLLNVIYFKGEWKKQFPEENTTLGKFYLDVDK
ncbi:serine protease inhibitor 27A-like [Ctenocephalides felis]|uniref:serine protease inhibitor 27A-like n=1 Tax=Ctenocephalides felis TaxID=7515 RepID=UPI000E6E5A4E|nr:serine protease inhibitor 27A-like [Ctenocephalides felis]